MEAVRQITQRENTEGGPSRVAMMGRLLKLSNLVLTPFLVVFADRYSINLNELRVLMTLASMREAAAHEIAREAAMRPMNVSRAVATLTRAGRIAARPDADGRRKLLTLTPKGRDLYEAMLPHVRRMSDVLFDSMSPLETEFFAKLLAKLVERLDSIDPTDPMLIGPEEPRAATPKRAPAPKARKSVGRK